MYEIIIKKIGIEEKPAGREWAIISQDFVTVEDYRDKEYYRQGEIDKAYADGNIPKLDKYGYTPEIIKKVKVEETILTQKVEELDLAKVIKAVNSIG
jgi:hypothetical protein